MTENTTSPKSECEIGVSIICAAYNHERYIRQCLDGFIMQKTNFTFEVLVNDDNSPDHTADIIREYEKRYPNIIKPIYQTENQYSKRVRICAEILFPKAKGKYIAFCEGDDYWIDETKLQKQYDIMEANPDCHLCCHRVLWVSQDGKSLKKTCPMEYRKTGKHSSADFIEGISMDFYHINSFFIRREDYNTYLTSNLEFAQLWQLEHIGDSPLGLYMAQLGEVFYFSDVMSYYRPYSSPTSWSNTKKDSTKVCESCIQAMVAFDRYTNGKFHVLCLKYIQKKRIQIEATKHDYKFCVAKENRGVLRHAIPSKRWRMKIYLGAWFSQIINFYNSCKKRKI